MTSDSSFLLFIAMQRRRHSNRLYIAILVAVLIALLLYQTQWLALRPGLIVLLGGQLVDVSALLFRNVQLSRDMQGVMNESTIAEWFKREELFIKALGFFDAACQMVGFLALGYAFWISTRSLGIALAIGIVYPLTFYFGVNRRKTSDSIRILRAQKQELQ